ncbi:hypothetical protein DSUL_60311 [Desulfovibrionales bacterium]
MTELSHHFFGHIRKKIFLSNVVLLSLFLINYFLVCLLVLTALL